MYVLRSLSSGIYYVGFTTDIERRLVEHNKGKSKFTSGHIPWEIVYTEQIAERKAARLREKYLKSAAGKRWLEREIKNRSGGSLPD